MQGVWSGIWGFLSSGRISSGFSGN